MGEYRRPLCTIIYSNEFRDILKSISDNMIAKLLLKYENDQLYKFTMSFINVTDKSDSISYISSTNNLFAKNKWNEYREIMEIEYFVTRITSITDRHILNGFKDLYMNAYKDKTQQKKPSNDNDIIKKLIQDTKLNKIVWEEKIDNKHDTTSYTCNKKITSKKILSISIFVYKNRPPNVYIDIVEGKQTKVVKHLYGVNTCYDLLSVILVYLNKK